MRKDNPNLTIDDLYKTVSNYITDTNELKVIKKAYEFAYEKHFNQRRLTGEEYIIHPLNVAYILSTINADYQTICAGLLHDVIEDCGVTKKEMTDKFGEEITNLIDGVTKINKLNFTGENEAVVANHRKILVGLTEDVRVIIIKLADRLHNMRTLWVQPEKKQKKKAKETLDILTPVAHRLGMNHFKSELEDLCLRYLKPDVFFSIVEKLNKTKNERDRNVEEMKLEVSKILNEHGIKHEIKGRAKSIYSIYKKLDTGRRFSDIYDLLALRVFVDNEQDCYQAMGIIHSKYRPIPKRFKDYVAMPKANGYQSLHTTVFGIDGILFEIQIRTYEMDKVAENGIASHWSYKEKGRVNLQSEMEKKLQFFKNIMELSSEENNDEEFVNNVKEDVLKKTIYVFTPRGDVIELPLGSTPIDFAYKVHTKVGDNMVGAIVNNSIVPLDYILNDNDIVKINTSNNSKGPSREWLKIAKTGQARNKIKNFFNKIDKEEYLKRGEDLLVKELRKKKIPTTDFYKEEKLKKIFEELKIDSLSELYINIGNNKFSPISVINICIKDENINSKPIIIDKKIPVQSINPKGDIMVKGIDTIKIDIASCCTPIPQDRIVGYISTGNGINIHRSVCPNISELNERLIEVSWNNTITKRYSTNILVHTKEEKDLLLNIITKTATNNISVQSINKVISHGITSYAMNILVSDKDNLLKFMNDLKIMPEVIEVERVIR